MAETFTNCTLWLTRLLGNVFRTDTERCQTAVPTWDVTEVIQGQVTGQYGDVRTLSG